MHLSQYSVYLFINWSKLVDRFGGGNGGVKINPLLYSQSELEKVAWSYTLELANIKFIGPKCDSLGPDLGTNE